MAREDPGSPSPDPRLFPTALYVHVPFCLARCAYCDFAREIYSPALVRAYLEALEQELAAPMRWRGAEVFAPRTVFIGGGTPSSLTGAELAELFALLSRHVDLSRVEEFTVEANPGTLDAAKLEVCRSRGANRLSLGVQSFQPRLLEMLGRIHDAAQARAAVRLARAAGFTNVSLDLLHGVPTETRAELARDLDAAAELQTEHLSAYGILLEEGTRLATAVARGEIAALTPEEEAAQYAFVMERLERAGLAQYEISNYARPGRECLHNLVYWRNEAYLGLGPSAASCINVARTVNIRHLDAYLAAVSARGEAVAERERLDDAARARESLVLELRLRRGVLPSEFRARWGLDLDADCGACFAKFAGLGMMERTAEGRWRITRRGLPVADSILSELV